MIPCPSCQRLVSSQSSFCNLCGVKLQGFAERILSEEGQVQNIEISEKINSDWGELKDIIRFYVFLMLNTVIFTFVFSSFGDLPKLQLYYWGIDLVLIAWMSFKYRENIKTFLSFKIPTAREVLEIVLYLFLAGVFIELYFQLLTYFGWPMENYSKDFAKHGWPSWSIYIFIAILPGILEELAFRGIIFNSLEKILYQKEALIIQAACFSLLHLSPVIIISHFVMGLTLGWVRIKTNSLYYGMLIHIAWNAYVISSEI
jgi:uncharacterized protein